MPDKPQPPDPPRDSPSEFVDSVPPAKSTSKSRIVTECSATLDRFWTEIRARAEAGDTSDFLENDDLLKAISYSLNCKEKGYHYVLLTQIAAKVVNSDRDCRSLQAGAPVPGAFDARTIANYEVVDFERRNLEAALESSPAPYLINTFRVPLLDPDAGESKKDKRAWRSVCEVTSEVEKRNNNEFTERVLQQVLLEIYRKFGSTKIKYDVPLRASIAQVIDAVLKFTSEKSGGDRPLAVTSALFETIGKYTNLFQSSVRRAKINDSDESSGQVADIECMDANGATVLAIEVKDRTVTVSDLEEKLRVTRQKGIKEVFFVSGRGEKETEDVPPRIAKEFAAGQNLYVCNLVELSQAALALTGEASRRHFLIRVGEQLDKYSDTKHRLAWKKTLEEMSNR